MKEIIEAVMAKLKIGVPELRWIDLNVGQMNTENPPVDYPCALVDIANIDYSSAGCRRQLGTVTLEIELFFVVRAPANVAAPESLREQALSHFYIVQKVYTALEGLAGEHFTGLNRISSRRDKTYYPRGFTIVFRCSLEDRAAVPTYQKLSDVKPEIKMT
ncbi:MAG: hypothetical protein RSA53_05440 [Odoribacter sp.]